MLLCTEAAHTLSHSQKKRTKMKMAMTLLGQNWTSWQWSACKLCGIWDNVSHDALFIHCTIIHVASCFITPSSNKWELYSWEKQKSQWDLNLLSLEWEWLRRLDLRLRLLFTLLLDDEDEDEEDEDERRCCFLFLLLRLSSSLSEEYRPILARLP